jgi:hypothetical protein
VALHPLVGGRTRNNHPSHHRQGLGCDIHASSAYTTYTCILSIFSWAIVCLIIYNDEQRLCFIRLGNSRYVLQEDVAVREISTVDLLIGCNPKSTTACLILGTRNILFSFTKVPDAECLSFLQCSRVPAHRKEGGK